MDEDLKGQAAKWLEEQGFPLEMRAARAMAAADLTVEISTSVPDLETGKECEVDVVASAFERLHTGYATFTLLSECKHSSDKPWIGFVGEEPNYHRPSDSVYNRIATRTGSILLLELSVGHRHRDNPVFALPKRLCYGIVRAFSQKMEDMAYAAMAKAERSCISKAAYSDRIAGEFRMPSPVEVYFPLVITDAPLFECALKEDGTPTLTEATQLTLVRNRPLGKGGHQIVQIFHENALSGFLQEFSTGWAEIAKHIREGVPTTSKVMEKHSAQEAEEPNETSQPIGDWGEPV